MIDSLGSEAGTENQIIEMVRRVDRRRLEVVMGCMEDGARFQALAPYATLLLFPCIQVFSFEGLRQILHLRREVNARSIDVVHALVGRSVILGVLGGRLSRCRAIVTSRRNLGYWFGAKPFYLWLYRVLNRVTTRLMTNSEGARRATVDLEWVPASRIDVLYNGVDVNRFTGPCDPALPSKFGWEKWGWKVGAPVVGIVANYRPVKDLFMFLRAAKLVAAQEPEAIFVMVGRGPLKETLQRLATELGIAGRVILTDDQGDVAGLLACFTIGCLTSNSESFPNSILEYMAAGLAVVATDVGGVSEAVEDHKTGLLVPIGDAESFAGAVVSLLRDSRLRSEMGELARRRCEERFSWPAITKQYEDYYLKLAGKG